MKSGPGVRSLGWSDERLIRECCEGNQAAWFGLVEKYKNLIFSIPIKFGLSREDAADVFQSVCVELLKGLPRLREPKALPKWLMQTTFHQCIRWKKDRLSTLDGGSDLTGLESAGTNLPEEIVHQLNREQNLREAIASLPPRCRQMVSMLFFEVPARPYEEVAKELKLATGSIGFVRGRCLQKLKRLLEARGFS